MEIKLTHAFLFPQAIGIKRVLLIQIMKVFVLLFCFTAFSFTPADVLSQNAKIEIEADKTLTVDQVFDLIMEQTDYKFIYQEGLFKDFPNVDVKKGVIRANKLLDKSLSSDAFSFSFTSDNTIVIKEEIAVTTPSIRTQQVVSGQVIDQLGNPLPGATVIIKGKSIGKSTDFDGNFEINAAKGDILVISYVGYATQEVTVTGDTILVALNEQVSDLDEVQIIAYGTTTKRTTTGAISTVKGEAINLRPVDNVMQALQGQVSGLAISSPASGIGAPQQILIRGVNSITSGTNPLIIIDGVIINDNPGGLINGGSNRIYIDGNAVLNSLNPNDIQSVDILKDADATAIYGSRGTNGVIIITTKGAKLGETTVNINVSTGVSRSVGNTERLNTEQYLKFRRDAFAMGNATTTSAINPIVPDEFNAPDLTLWSQTAYTDYVKFEMGKAALNYNADISMTGGTKSLNFLTSVSYAKKYDVYIFDPYQERFNGRIKLNHTSKNDKFKLSLNSLMGIDNQAFAPLSLGSAVSATSTNAPNFELYNEDGSFNYASGQGYIRGNYYNPLPNQYIDLFSKTKNVMLSGDMSYEFVEDLVGKIQVSYNSQNNDYKNIYPTAAINVQNSSSQVPEGNFSTNQFQSVNFEPQLTYTKSIGKGTITALVGGTLLSQETKSASFTVTDPGDDALLYSFSSGNPFTASSNKTNYKFNSSFGRLSMDWDGKYLANLTFRRDGSSRFGSSNRFANFGSVGAAWIFTEEAGLKNSKFLSFGKIRGSYGTTGNNNIGDYGFLGLLSGSPSPGRGEYQGNPRLNSVNYANPDLQWEKTTKFDIGLSLGFINDRILLNASYYNSLTTNLLAQLPLTSQTGFDSYVGNFDGEVENKGFEIDLTTYNLSKNSSLSWKTTFNITINKNQLKKYDGLEDSPYANTLEVGRELPTSLTRASYLEFPFRFIEINPDNGVPIYEDVNGDGEIDTNDYNQNDAWFGSSTPSTWGGMTNSLSYKNFTLDIFAQFSNGIFTKWNSVLASLGSIENPSKDVIGNYWTQPGDIAKYPRLNTGVTGGEQSYLEQLSYYSVSTATLYKGYYIRLKNVRLTYSIPTKVLSQLNIERAMFYINGENLAVFTPEKLFKDPETIYSQSAGPLSTISAGLQLSF